MSLTGVGAAPAPGEVPRPRGRSVQGRRHCWVVLDGLEPMPGVIAGWCRTDGGSWEARVSYVLGDETGGVVTGWLPAAVLRPYDATPTATGVAAR